MANTGRKDARVRRNAPAGPRGRDLECGMQHSGSYTPILHRARHRVGLGAQRRTRNAENNGIAECEMRIGPGFRFCCGIGVHAGDAEPTGALEKVGGGLRGPIGWKSLTWGYLGLSGPTSSVRQLWNTWVLGYLGLVWA